MKVRAASERIMMLSAVLALALVAGATTSRAQEPAPVAPASEEDDILPHAASPDGRFVVRTTEVPDEDNEGDLKVELIEEASGKRVADLDRCFSPALSRIVLVWSADSKWLAYGSGGQKERGTTVYWWNGTGFRAINLPDNLPTADVKIPKSADGDVKNYGGGVKPVRWLTSGDLELESESVMMSRVDDHTYTARNRITVKFDKRHHVSVKKVSPSKTEVD